MFLNKKEIFAFCVITFEPIRFQTYLVHQNDNLNLIFVKDKYTVGRKWPEMAVTWAIVIVIHFYSEYTRAEIIHINISLENDM